MFFLFSKTQQELNIGMNLFKRHLGAAPFWLAERRIASCENVIDADSNVLWSI